MTSLLAVAAAWWILAVALLPRDRRTAGLVGVSLVLSALAWSERVHMHVGRDLANQLAVFPSEPAPPDYGAAWNGLSGVLGLVAGDSALWLASLVPVALTALATAWLRVAVDDDDAGTAAGLVFAMLPMTVAFSAISNPFVAVAPLHATALAGLSRSDRWSQLLAGVSIALLAHLRPLQAGIAVGFVALAVYRRRQQAAVIGGLYVAMRVAAWSQQPPGLDGLQAHVLAPWSWLGSALGPDAHLVWLDPTRTPAALVALAAMASRQRAARPFLVLAAADLLLYAHQPAIADRLRFQLPALLPLAALSGLALSHLDPRPLAAALALAGASWWPARQPFPPFAWQTEHALLAEAADAAPGDVEVAFRLGPYTSATTRWLNRRSRARWIPYTAEPPDDAWLWVGLADHAQGVGLSVGDREPVVEARFTPDWGDLDHYGPWSDDPVTVGLYAR
jgi:hypothetical protein